MHSVVQNKLNMETSAIEKIIKLVAKTGLFFASADGVYTPARISLLLISLVNCLSLDQPMR